MRDDNRTHRDPIATGDLVFVYGTLRAGQPNHKPYLGSAVRCGEVWTTVDRYRLLDLGAFPAAEHMTGEPGAPGRGLVGEVYRVRAETGRYLDHLEGNGRLYRRALRTVCRGGGAEPIHTADELEFGAGAGWVRAWVFEIVGGVDAPVIESGDWLDVCDRTGAASRSCGECGHPMRATGRNASSDQTVPMGLYLCETAECPSYGSPVLIRLDN